MTLINSNVYQNEAIGNVRSLFKPSVILRCPVRLRPRLSQIPLETNRAHVWQGGGGVFVNSGDQWFKEGNVVGGGYSCKVPAEAPYHYHPQARRC